ncbi:DUF4320 family protein [Romboutsia sp. 1001216sp1]|uniref:DUF4320 family protein n=1 Tax=unclassified Romboutsia TaxID=2626894 RepID=UPI00189EDF7A|nr:MULTISPECIES: DUF4320 family protein [unclassified Romboutsia]MDB8803195.1 DUF4320 family protein [Romboutsia sp. 1001216sp1]MDB8814554.1 DUF4320 family protein [Romboutsia sp. 1001216sp1]
MKILKNKKGQGYVDVAVMVLVFALVMAFALSVFPVFVAKSNLNKFAIEVIREAETTGQIGSSVQDRINKLKKDLGNVDSIDWKVNYIYGTNKIQLGDPIEVTVKKNVNIGFFKFGSFPIPLQSKDSGFSEVYWK